MLKHIHAPTVASAFLFVCVGIFASPCSAADNNKPSFFGWKENFYKYAPHTRREDLVQTFKTESGTDNPITYTPHSQPGTVASGRAPSLAMPTPKTQAIAPTPNQSIRNYFMQKEFTEYSNPLWNNWGPPMHGIPVRHILPHNPIPRGINPQSFEDAPYLTGATPASDLVEHCLKLGASQRIAEKLLDPSLPTAQSAYQGATQQTADAVSSEASGSFDANLNSTSSPIINVANETAATPAHANQKHRSLSHAVWIVQQMYKRFFVPLAVLLLLVGAVATQVTTFVRYSFIDSELDAGSRRPFEGLLRAVVAVFLIGAMQLIVSYFIDFGNAMTESVHQAIDSQSIKSWANQVTNPARGMTSAQIDEFNKEESTASATTRAVYGTVHALLNTTLTMLTVYQIVMVCYLLLLGPIAAAMFAWPDGVGTLFCSIFGNWLNGLSNLVLWKFWWCVILLCMSTRIQWLKDIGSYSPGSPWEPIVYTAFMVMLTYVPFGALDFRPGDMVDALLDKASKRT